MHSFCKISRIVDFGELWSKEVSIVFLNEKSYIHIKFERGNRRYRALNSLAGFACLVFWITHHGPRWPISVEKRRFAPFFGRNWPPGPMMGDPKNQACDLSNAPPNYSDFWRFFVKFAQFGAAFHTLKLTFRVLCAWLAAFFFGGSSADRVLKPSVGWIFMAKTFFLYACRTFFFDGSSAGASMSRIAWHSRACMSLGSRRFLGKKLSMSLKESCMSSFRTCIKTRRHLKERGVS